MGAAFSGGPGAYFANAGDDLHPVGSLDPMIPGYIGCIAIAPDGSRRLAHAEPDPLFAVVAGAPTSSSCVCAYVTDWKPDSG